MGRKRKKKTSSWGSSAKPKPARKRGKKGKGVVTGLMSRMGL